LRANQKLVELVGDAEHRGVALLPHAVACEVGLEAVESK
jgi:hypothetical protein